MKTGYYITGTDNVEVVSMELTSLLNLVIFGMVVYIGLIVVPSLLENKNAH